MEKNIIIVGAGAAGLMAARELIKRGWEVTILEAREQTGGRIRRAVASFAGVAEPGAEFVHGKLPLTFDLLREAGLTAKPVEGEMINTRGRLWEQQEEMTIGWDRLVNRMEALNEDMTMANFLSAHFGEPKYEALRHSVRGYAQGFDLADIKDASVFALRDEWVHEEGEQYRVEGGYTRFTDYMEKQLAAAGCQIRVGITVKKINWQAGHVQVTTAGGLVFEAPKILITIPVGVLQAPPDSACAIRLDPELPAISKAFQEIGFGSVTKILLQFARPFWQKWEKDIGFILSDEVVPTWWTQYPDPFPLMTGWLGGPPAIQAGGNPQEILQLALLSLANIFKTDAGELKKLLQASHVEIWHTDPFTLGAYSYSILKTGTAIKKLREPVEQTLYFAGEAIYEGPSPGTVEAALQSGIDAAGRLFADLA